MSARQDYNTKARKCILDFLEQSGEGTVSVSDITEYMEREGVSVNRATVYRYLKRLTDERRVLKFTEDETQKSVYQFVGQKQNCDEHIHIKCIRCGRLMHLECGFTENIKKHLAEEHGFLLHCEGSILYGLCETCRKYGESQ